MTTYSKITLHKIAILPLGMVNAFLLVNSHGCILIDSGLPNTEHKIEEALKRQNLTFTDIKLIIITHAHIDHAGNAAKIKALSGAKVIVHRGDLPYYKGERKMHFCSTGWFGRAFLKTGAIQKSYAPFEPDILLSSSERFSLHEYGINGEVISTPGHTEGSISVIFDNNNAVVGDLIASGILLGGIIRTGRAKRPPFEDQPLQVGLELESIAKQGVTTFYMGHGGPLPQEEVLRHAKFLKNLQITVAK